MTKVLRLFEQEKEEAVKKAAEEAAKKAAEEAMKKATEEAMKKAAEEAKKAAKHTALEIAKNLLDILPITEIAKRTGLSIDEVAELAKETKN